LIDYLITAEVQQFIKEHRNDDPAALMLSAQAKHWPYFDKVVEQIWSRQKAKGKLDHWLGKEGIVFPPPISVEQASSDLTGKKKASLVNGGEQMIDLTGGFGIDTYYLSQKFEHSTYVEQSEELCQCAKHNFKVLGRPIDIINAEAERVLNDLSPADLIYVDPARRDGQARKVFKLSDCLPDVAALQHHLLTKAKQVLIKLSPLLDIKSVLSDLEHVKKVFAIAVKNEVKELLILMEADFEGDEQVHCVNLGQHGEDEFSFHFSEEAALNLPFAEIKRYLYEPNAAIMKAGGFKSVGERFQLFKLHANTHLYTSSELKPDFPGRIFDVLQPLPFEKKKLKKIFPDMQANITVRNFPMSVAALRKKTQIKEGGEHYILACTGQEGKLLLLTKKIKQNSHGEWGS